MLARDDLRGYAEGRVLEAANSLNIAQEEVVCRHDVLCWIAELRI